MCENINEGHKKRKADGSIIINLSSTEQAKYVGDDNYGGLSLQRA